jgi:hypothetical protein
MGATINYPSQTLARDCKYYKKYDLLGASIEKSKSDYFLHRHFNREVANREGRL